MNGVMHRFHTMLRGQVTDEGEGRAQIVAKKTKPSLA